MCHNEKIIIKEMFQLREQFYRLMQMSFTKVFFYRTVVVLFSWITVSLGINVLWLFLQKEDVTRLRGKREDTHFCKSIYVIVFFMFCDLR